ncbi:MAG: DUF4145 domain-containing protein [Candidatus Omnitrophica bacterium]|nr:DUF4145 domain-containing protein [Candidatus Omnitrophota bacterium]
MIIECPDCNAKVDGKIVGTHEWMPDWGEPTKLSIVICPICEEPIVGISDIIDCGDGKGKPDVWANPKRLWPTPVKDLAGSIPNSVCDSIDEAKKCFSAKAYSACAVMCGRALEAICIEHKTESKVLAKGLEELKEKGIIDQRIFEWSRSLREERNLGAHATGIETSKEDASDLLDFVIAICDYIFVLTAKYKKYCDRKKNKSS